MKIKGNIFENDYLNVIVLADKIEYIENSYADFGWKVFEKKPHPIYSNLLELRLVRNHFIKNKNELQYYQVAMETEVNNINRLNKQKYARSVLFCSLFSLLSITLLALTIHLFLTSFQYLFGAFSLIAFLLSIPYNVYKTRSIAIKEKNELEKKVFTSEKNISSYRKKAISLREDNIDE